MGLKGAAFYFQRMMASIVLAGLLYITVELYLHDVLVYATTEEEFTERLGKLFQQFRQHNITLSPKKSGTYSRPMACTSQPKRGKRY